MSMSVSLFSLCYGKSFLFSFHFIVFVLVHTSYNIYGLLVFFFTDKALISLPVVTDSLFCTVDS
jgi:hypothetical protein